MSAPLLAPGHELLDDPGADPDIVRSSLWHIARANRWFGGWWAVRRGLERLLGGSAPLGGAAVRRLGGSRNEGSGGYSSHSSTSEGPTTASDLTPSLEPPSRRAAEPPPITLLDVGCGTGDLARRAVHWARRRGLTLVPIGIERHRAAAELARDGGLPTALACASHLPLRDAGVDIVIASQLMHHLAEDAIVAFLQAANRLARQGVIIADLRRSPLAEAGFWAGSRLLGFDAATRADGITSVRRGFSAADLARLTRRAGLTARIERTPGFRLVATWTAGAART